MANVARKEYDLAVFDIRMPKMNGFELYREFVKIENHTRVCFITAFEIYMSEFKRMFPDIEPAGLLKKPFSVEEFVGRVESLLSFVRAPLSSEARE